MKNIALILSFSLLSGFLFGQENKPSGHYHLGFRVAPRISTLGAGLEVAKGLTPNFGLRAGFNYFSYAYDATESDVSYDFDLELKSFAIFTDWHPFKGAFRLSGGMIINGNGLNGNAKPTGSVKIGDTDYTGLNSIDLDISYNALAPYVGIGWDTTFGDHDNWGFAFDLGLIYSGSPEAAITTDATVSASDIEKEKQELQNDLDTLKWWPVISAGLVYQF